MKEHRKVDWERLTISVSLFDGLHGNTSISRSNQCCVVLPFSVVHSHLLSCSSILLGSAGDIVHFEVLDS